MVSVINEQSTYPIDVEHVENLVNGFLHASNLLQWELSVVFVSPETSANLNAKYRKKSGPTNVLSFPLQKLKPGQTPVPEDDGTMDLGDIIICPAVVQKNAQEWNTSFSLALDRLLVHGFAHLLGYDHQNDNEHKIMTTFEEKLIGRKIDD